MKTSILDHAGGNVEEGNARGIHKAAETGDGPARELIFRTGYYLGIGFANLLNLFNPERIVIGGGLSNMGDLLLGEAKRVAGKRAYQVAYQAVDFVLAELGRNSGVLGAAAFALQEIEK
jgi:glucokinase